MAKNSDNAKIYGGDGSAWWMAPKGTTAPVGLAAYGAGWKEAGWLADPVEYGQEADFKEFPGHQGGAIIKKVAGKVKRTFKLVCLEETALILGLVHPGSTITTTAGVTTIKVPVGIPSNEMAFGIDEVSTDGKKKRFIIPAGEAFLSGTVKHSYEDITAYEFELNVYGAMDIITDSPSLAVV